MNTKLQLGDKVKYKVGDGWAKGTIHAVREVDDANGVPRVLSYLVDTGNDHRLDVFTYDLKSQATHAEFKKYRDSGLPPEEAHAKAVKATAKLPAETIEVTERQPEQIDLRPEDVIKIGSR